MAGKEKPSAKSNIQSLVVVESPAKIKTISKFLGANFKIVSTFGHVKDLPEKKIGVEVDGKNIEIIYTPIKGKGVVINDICREAKKSGEVYLASDPDREGEIISYHIGEEIKKATKGNVNIFRIVFNEITQSAVKKAIEDKHEIDLKKVAAQQARRILDRWVGYEVSPILWRKIAKGLSAGRVQSVAVMFICNREEEVVNFKPEESWSITATHLNEDKFTFDSQLFKIKNKPAALKTEKDAKKVVGDVENEKFVVKEVVDKERAKKPLAPFITSSLQQDAYNKLGFSVDKTMMIAQKLYEGLPLQGGSQEALISYMRTDSTRLSDTALSDIRTFIQDSFGDKYLPKKSVSYSKGGAAQDAHEAIRPISVHKTPESIKQYLEPNFYKLYELIWRRAIACQMTPANYAQRQVLIEAGKDYVFKATGSSLIFDGFLKVYKPEEDEEKTAMLPEKIVSGELLGVEKIAKKQHFTQPPPRYTEASLVKELEKQGIGRPSTYAAIMTTIQRRKYVEKQSKKFIPTELGKAVVKMLVENLSDIINVTFTAKMEDDLDKIAEGSIERDEVLLGFYSKFKKDLEKFADFSSGAAPTKFTETEIECPKCKKNKLLIRLARTGEFLACSGFPDCKFTSSFEREGEEGIIKMIDRSATKELEMKCPNCGKNLVEKTGRFGKFAACPGFPDCKYIHKTKKFGAKKDKE